MIPPRLDQSGSAFDRRLVRAARAEAPRPGAEEAALASLGLLGGAMAAGRARPVHSANSLTVGGGAKALLAAIGIALGVMATGWTLAHRTPAGHGPGTSATHPAPVASPANPLPTAQRVPVPPSSMPVPPSIAATPVAPVLEPASRQRPSTPDRKERRGSIKTSPAAADLSVEAALVQRAAHSLAGGDARAALLALDEYGERCPHGALAQEAGLLRVRALVATGRSPEAAALAQQLRAADPRGFLARQFGAVLDGGASP
jgi:hypothetical protein